MSKVDQLRAMREARWEAAQKTKPAPKNPKPERTSASGGDAAGGGRKTPPASRAERAETPVAECGHQSISKKRCTRPAGHSEKYHRYS